MGKGNIVHIDRRRTYRIHGVDPPALLAHAPLRMYNIIRQCVPHPLVWSPTRIFLKFRGAGFIPQRGGMAGFIRPHLP